MKAQIWNLSAWIKETEPFALLRHFEEMLKESGFNVLHVVQHNFDPQGFTALFLLSESHLAIHTFPEEQTTYVELSSCVELPFKTFSKLLYA